jgi:hypothetical protein
VYATTTWDPNGAGPEPEPLVVGGGFATAGGVSANHIVRWNGTSWQPLEHGTDSITLALTVHNGDLIAGGHVARAGGPGSADIARGHFFGTAPTIVQQPRFRRIAVGDTATFTVVTEDAEVFQWRRGGVPLQDGSTPNGSTIGGAATDSLTVINAQVLDGGFYDVVLTNAYGSTASRRAWLQVGAETLGGWLGPFELDLLDDSSRGAVLCGRHAHDLAGSVLTRVPDVDGDGDDELVIGARFGKPVSVNPQGVGFGEAYLIYGSGGNNTPENPRVRLHGVHSLREVGQETLQGLVFPGMRMPMNTTWTQGLADVACVPDLDGDDRPEIVFGFPRAESLSLKAPHLVQGVAYQDLALEADLPGMGNLEYDAINYGTGQWTANTAQFVRGGVVIVSSHNAMLLDAARLNRRGDRVLDLHEVGQLFDTMTLPTLTKYVRNVEPDMSVNAYEAMPAARELERWWVVWDTVFSGAGPGGFCMPWTDSPADPPLSNPIAFAPARAAAGDAVVDAYSDCLVLHRWYAWVEESECAQPLPGTSLTCLGAWATDPELATCAWTGFYGPAVTPPIYAPVGARVLGQSVDDHLGATVSADKAWLYLAAPQRTARREDIPTLPEDRPEAGVVYQYRTNARWYNSSVTLTQLWIEPNQAWPHPDSELPERTDYTMPVPHQYIIKTVGSLRGNPAQQEFVIPAGPCTPAYDSGYVAPADDVLSYRPYPLATAGFYVAHVPQVVGPHEGARIAFVRALGDVDADGVGDFAVGSQDVRDADSSGAFVGPVVGSVFIVYGRPLGLDGDYLLERLALSHADPSRLNGVLIQGTTPAEPLGRAFDAAGDFNGDGIADVIIGSEYGAGGRGEAIVVFGSPTLESPAGGWTVAEIVAAGRAIHILGEEPGDRAGANVAGAGDVDGDGFDDVLIAAPDAANGRGKVYLVYGSPSLSGELDLSDIAAGTLPGAMFIGRNTNDYVGGGETTVFNTDPSGGWTRANSRGVAALGDIDGDGFDDFAISAMLASPDRATEAGEVYICYGGPRTTPGDLTVDGMVDLADFLLFSGCMGGPDVADPPGCDPMIFERADLHQDNDVDLDDFADFQVLFGFDRGRNDGT